VTRHRRGPRPLAAPLTLLQDELSPPTLLAEVQGVWASVVGPVIAAEATPARERSGVVTVSCSASVWAQELELMGEPIVQRLNGTLRRGQIERLRCVAVDLLARESE
jgi:predicted nucleic acid-binding Zn ribbon protein